LNRESLKSNPWNAYSRSLKRQGVFITSLIAIAFIASSILASTTYFALLGLNHMNSVLYAETKSTVMAASLSSARLADDAYLASLGQLSDIDLDDPQYALMLSTLKQYQASVGADRIYIVMHFDDDYIVILDTADNMSKAFTEIDLSQCQAAAFAGRLSADINEPDNPRDAFNQGASPIQQGDTVIAVVSVEFDNTDMVLTYKTMQRITRLLISCLFVLLSILLTFAVLLFRQNQRNQQQLFDMANKDMTTGLPNRRYLFNYLTERLTSPDSDKIGVPLAAFFIDIDDFKVINDRSGHAEGDKFLALASDILTESLDKIGQETHRECLTARLGGDEFIQLLAEVTMSEAIDYVKSLMAAFDLDPQVQPYIEKYNVTLSIGIALYPEHTDHYNDLMKFADIAMYHAKLKGKHQYVVYEPDMGDHIEGITLSVREARDR